MMSEARGPNILVLMADQLAPAFLPAYGHPVVKAPNLSRLAAESLRSSVPTRLRGPLCACSSSTSASSSSPTGMR